MNLEVVATLPVADVDRAKAFYASLGWRFDIDLGGVTRKLATDRTKGETR